MGFTLQPSSTPHQIFDPSSHSLPVIRCVSTDIDAAEIKLYQYDTGLRSIKSLSPLFGKLWNDNSSALGPEYDHMLRKCKKSTFRVVR